ncbi:MAG: acetyl-CoA C-acetyltransferase [Candidatus Hydrothermales bacterium]
MKEVFIISGVRTPVGKILGNLSSLNSTDLGGIVIKEAVKRANIPPEKVDEVIMGCVLPAGLGQAPARIASIKAGLNASIPAFTVNKVCGSGLKACMLGVQAIKAGDIEVAICGGMESMSNAPHLLNLRSGVKYGDSKAVDHMVYDGLWCSFNNQHMGNLAEYTARKAGITREEQDKLAYESHMKAVKATKEGKFKEEIIPIEIKTKEGIKVIDRDESPREDTSLEKLAELKPVFEKDGTVTAGNAPGLNDGAAAVVIASEKAVKELNLKPIARVISYATNFVEPKELFFAPIGAIKKLTEKSGLKHPNDFDLMEINEAFAAQFLADAKALELDTKKVNVHGGAIAIGHPIGASGARILVTLIHALKHYGKKKGFAALCLGGGGAVSLSIEMV